MIRTHRRPLGLLLFVFTTVGAVLSAAAIEVRAADPPAKPWTSVVAPGGQVTPAGADFQFTEGPTPDADGNVYFSDVRAARTHKWRPDGKITLVRENTNRANGLAFDQHGNLLACEGEGHRVVAVDPQGKVNVVADRYDGKPFNQPNDLWIDPQGGVYFSDPNYGGGKKPQDKEAVYYVSPDRTRVVRVVDDLTRPNGLAGTPDGKHLYIADQVGLHTYLYDIQVDGTLANKRLFANRGSDGMKLDSEGNVYLTAGAIYVYDPSGQQREKIEVPQAPANLCFAGPDGRTLFITARTGVYTLPMRVRGSQPLQQAAAAK